MKHWNFETQIIVTNVILVCCFILSTLTKQGIFSNIGWIISGTIHVLHPVCPETWKWKYAGDEKRMNRDFRIAGAILILIGLMTRFGV